MTHISRRSAGLISVAAAAALLAATPLAASAVETAEGSGRARGTAEAGQPLPSFCTPEEIRGFTPGTIVLGTKAAAKTFDVGAPTCSINSWKLEYRPFLEEAVPGSTRGIAGFNWSIDDVDLGDTITLDPRLLKNSLAGPAKSELNRVRVTLNDTRDFVDGQQTLANAQVVFDGPVLLRQSTFGSTFKTSAATVKKGKKIGFTGKLVRANWNGAATLKTVAFAQAKVRVQYKASGTTTWKTAKTVTADADGKIKTTVTASKSATWRLNFSGISTTAAVNSKTAAVKVKQP